MRVRPSAATRAAVVLCCVLAATSLAFGQASLEKAQELFVAGQFDAAASMYGALASDEPNDGALWYGLARARHEGGEHAEAAELFDSPTSKSAEESI